MTKENSTSAPPAASFLVDIGKAEFSTGECNFFFFNKSRSSSKLKKDYF